MVKRIWAVVTLIGLATIQQVLAQPLPQSQIIERRHNGVGQFTGIVDGINSVGFRWFAVWHDNTSKHSRTLEISVDENDKIMTIIESGGGGGAPVQKWQGKYRLSGTVYKMEGTLVEENGDKRTDSFDISATLVLP